MWCPAYVEVREYKMYRTNAKQTVVVRSYRPKLWTLAKVNFFKLMFWITRSEYFFLKSVASSISGIPSHLLNCVDCNRSECVCGE